jgi:hypothetical protein
MNSKLLIAAQFIALAGLVLSTTAQAAPQSESATSACSNASLTGSYGKLYGGAAVDGTPTVSVQKISFDPKIGQFTSYTTASHNGVISSLPVPGTYAVAANCTVAAGFGLGTVQNIFSLLVTPTGFLYTSQWDGATTEGFGVKLGSPTCTRAGVAGTYGFEATGQFVAGAPITGPVAYIGPLTLKTDSSGDGVITGRLAGSENGTIHTFAGDPVSGSYTIEGSCWGKATIALGGRSEMHFRFLVVDNGKQILTIETDANTVVSGSLVKSN